MTVLRESKSVSALEHGPSPTRSQGRAQSQAATAKSNSARVGVAGLPVAAAESAGESPAGPGPLPEPLRLHWPLQASAATLSGTVTGGTQVQVVTSRWQGTQAAESGCDQ